MLLNMLFAAATDVGLVRFSDDEGIIGNLIHLEEGGVYENEEPLACARRAVLGML